MAPDSSRSPAAPANTGSAGWIDRVPSLRLAGWQLGAVLGLSVALWFGLGAVGDLLVTMHPPTVAGRGLAQGLSTSGLGGGTAAAAATFEVWRTFDALPYSAELISAFTVARLWLLVDFAFIAGYAVSVLALARPGGPLAGGGTRNTIAAARLLVLVIAAVDVVENALALYAVSVESTSDALYTTLFGLRALKVFVLTLPLIALLTLLVLRKARAVIAEQRVRQALIMARPQILVVGLIALALAYEPSLDVLLDIGTTQTVSLIVFGGFLCAGLSVGARVLIDSDRVAHDATLAELVTSEAPGATRGAIGGTAGLVIAGILGALGAMTGWRGLWGAALVVVAVLVASSVLQDSEPQEPQELTGPSSARLPAVVGLAPVGLVGVAMVHWTLWADVVLGELPVKALAGVAMTALAGALVAPIGDAVRKAQLGDDDGPQSGLRRLLGALARARGAYDARTWGVLMSILLVPTLLMLAGTRLVDVRYPGPLSLLFGAAATVNVIGSALVIGVDWWRDEFGMPSVFRALRMRRIPVFLLLATWLLVNSFAFADPTYYDLVTSGTNRRVSLADAYADWKAAAIDSDTAVVPLVVVAAEGGGLRAAYWTERVLSEVFDDAGVQPFALSGTSGGSVGIATYMAREEPIGGYAGAAGVGLADVGDPDFLSAVFQRWFTLDLAHALLGRPAPDGDRGAALADALVAEIPALGAPYDYAPGTGRGFQPVTVFNATDLQDGCLAPITTLSDLAGPAVTANDLGCLDPDRPAVSASGSPSFPGAADIAYECSGRGITFATAAVASSRSPYVTPAGRLEHCSGGVFYLGDGGYVDNSGAVAATVILERLEAMVAADNASGGACIVPILIQIDNGAENLIPGGQPTGNPSQLTIIFTGTLAATGARHEVAKVAAAAMVQQPLVDAAGRVIDVTSIGPDGDRASVTRYFRIFPLAQAGRDASVGWLLSQPSKDTLDSQLEAALTDIASVLSPAGGLSCG